MAAAGATDSTAARNRWAVQSGNHTAVHSASPAASWNPGSTTVGAITSGYRSRDSVTAVLTAVQVSPVGTPHQVVLGNRIQAAAIAPPTTAIGVTAHPGSRARRV